jgi:hypothetical protein
MNIGDRRSADHEPHEHDALTGHSGTAAGMMAMMVMMMSMCLGVVLLSAILPALGLPLGLAVAVGGGAIMLFVHGRMMRHGGR